MPVRASFESKPLDEQCGALLRNAPRYQQARQEDDETDAGSEHARHHEWHEILGAEPTRLNQLRDFGTRKERLRVGACKFMGCQRRRSQLARSMASRSASNICARLNMAAAFSALGTTATGNSTLLLVRSRHWPPGVTSLAASKPTVRSRAGARIMPPFRHPRVAIFKALRSARMAWASTRARSRSTVNSLVGETTRMAPRSRRLARYAAWTQAASAPAP